MNMASHLKGAYRDVCGFLNLSLNHTVHTCRP